MGSFIADLPLGGASGLPLTAHSDIRPLYEAFVWTRAEAWRWCCKAQAQEQDMYARGFTHEDSEAWAIESARRGIDVLKERDEALGCEQNEISKAIFVLPARSIEDLAMKLDCYLDFFDGDFNSDLEDPTLYPGLRLAFDLQEMLPDFRWKTIEHFTVAHTDYLVKPRELECAE